MNRMFSNYLLAHYESISNIEEYLEDRPTQYENIK